MKADFRLGIILSVIGISILISTVLSYVIHDYYLSSNNQNTFRLPAWLAVVAGFINFLGLWLLVNGDRNKRKQIPN